MQTITSNQNQIIKDIKALKQKKVREEKELYFIEGIRFVEEALKENVDIDRILISDALVETRGGKEILALVQQGKYDIYFLSDKLFREISDTDNPQGILATIRYRKIGFEDMLTRGSFYVILDSLQDPGNMGTIIRTADAAGVSGIIVSKGSVDIYNPKVLRATMGSIFHVPIVFSDDLTQTILFLKETGIKVYASHLRGKDSYFKVDMSKGTAIIIGNEANGISDEIAAQADVLVKIPMPGRAESLNASVAASLLMYEVVRQNK